MEINKRCISAFAKNGPFVALATKSKLFDPTFSLTSELILVNYMTGHVYPAITTELKFCKILWCEFADKSYLVAGHENGYISIYDHQEDGLVLLKTKECLQDDICALDFLFSKAVLVAASSKGKVIFWTLSNLEKEFTLDVPLPPNISAISCNPKVFKILCVGTSDGIIKVIDIKKLSVILTLNSKEFTEVKKLEWDLENNTKLRVMSEKGHISVFDLSNDSTSKIGNHNEPLIGFQGSTYVSKTQLETNGIFIQIPESFECSISSRDPVVALSHVTGVTQIISIPSLKKYLPFCRVKNTIISRSDAYKISFQNTFESTENNTSYDELIEKVNSNVDSTAIGEFLLENSAIEFDQESNADLDIDLDDQLTIELIKNEFENLKNSEIQVDLSVLDVFRTKDISVLSKQTDFRVLMVLCKLLNDFSELSRLKNPRVLAALIMFHKISDFSILNNSKEGKILKSILTKNFGMYLDSREPSSGCYLKKMKEYEVLLSNIKPFIKSSLDSKKLTEYFWYQVFLGNLEKVQDLAISDPDVQFYLKSINDDNLSNKMRGMAIQGNEKTVQQPIQSNISNKYSETRKNPIMPNTIKAQLADESFKATPSYPVQPVINQPAPYQAPSNIPYPSAPSIPKPTFKTPIVGTSNMPSMVGGYQQSGVPTMQNSFPQPPNAQSIQSQFQQPSILGGYQQSGVPTMQNSFQQPSAPHQNFACPPKSPFSGPVPMNPLRNSTFAGNKPQPTSILQPSINLPSKPLSSPQSMAQKSVSPQLNIQNVTSRSRESLSVENPELIISNFEKLIADVRQKAAQNNSMILKHRKTQFLNALNSYDSIDKTNIPSAILYAIDLVTKRIEVGGNNLKPDISLLVEGYNDVVWLRAFVELVKMVY